MLLAGFILGIALVVTGLAISQVAELEKEAAREQDISFVSEYRTVRSKFGVALADSVTAATTVTDFKLTLANVQANFRVLENNRGFDIQMTLAGGTNTGLCTQANALAARSECVTLTVADAATCPATGRKYEAPSDSVIDGACYDGLEDGIVQVAATIKAAYVFIHLDDGRSQIEDHVLFKLNR